MIEKLLEEYGFDDKSINTIVNYKSFESYKLESLKNIIISSYEYFMLLGYSKEEYVRIIKKCPSLLAFDKKNISNKINNLFNLGFTKDMIIKISTSFPYILALDEENINSTFYYFIKIGFTKEETILMIKNFPSLIGYNVEKLNKRIEQLKSIGYSKEDVILILKSCPSLFSYDINIIKEKIALIMECGYKKEEAFIMIKNLPQLAVSSLDSIKNKFDYYNSIGLHNYFVKDTKKLIQSVELSYARYEYLKEVKLQEKLDYCLFLSGNRFEKKFGISNDLLIKLYPYNEIEKKGSIY